MNNRRGTARRRNVSRRHAAQQRRKWVIVVAAVVIIALIGWFVLVDSSSDAAIRTDLEAEFKGFAPPDEVAEGSGVVEYDIVAQETTAELLDGLSTSVWALNGTVPGQAIRVKLGETVRVNFRNELPAETALHWHGVRVPNAMDGVPGVTQDPIATGGTFTYEFAPPDAGTYWYHSHMNSTEQVERGIHAPLIVEDAISAQYSQDVAWVIDDWPLLENGRLDPNFNDPTDSTHNGRWGNVITINGETDAQLKARPGERIRLRLINAAVARPWALRFPDFPADLIAIDGPYLRSPRSADATILNPGARADIDFVVPDTPGTYEIKDDFSTQLITLGTIVVEGDPVETPSFPVPSNPDVPDWDDATSVGVDLEFKLSLSGNTWQINGEAFPDVEPEEVFPDVFTRVRFTNNSIRLHPMHLHGQFFKVIERNGEPVDEGHWRDSVLLFKDDVIDVGLIATDVGIWAMHCHILEHAAAGMLTLVTVPARS